MTERLPELRRAEALVGELLGPAENRGPATFGTFEGSLPDKDYRAMFRLMAEIRLAALSERADLAHAYRARRKAAE